MNASPATVHALPIALAPIHQETLGSYLCRLAIANRRPAQVIAQLLGPVRAGFSPLVDETTWWSPEAPQRLAALTGRSIHQLAKALPVVAEHLRSGVSSSTPFRLSRLCRLCAARRGAEHVLVITRAPFHQHLCFRHHRWTRATCDIVTGDLPELLERQRRLNRLVRAHGPHMVHRNLELAQRILSEWAITEWWSGRLGAIWEDRLDRLPNTGDLSPDERHQLASFSEQVLLTALMLDPPGSTSDPQRLYQAMTAALGESLQISYVPRARYDPLYRHFCETQVE